MGRINGDEKLPVRAKGYFEDWHIYQNWIKILLILYQYQEKNSFLLLTTQLCLWGVN